MPRSKKGYDILVKTFSEGIFKLARYSHYPILGRFLNWFVFRGSRMFYVPMDRVIEIDESIETPDNMVLPSQVVTHFIEKAKHHWIMHKCICRAGSDCKDYPIDLGCLFLGETAMRINPELGRPVSREEALEHLQRCQEAGLIPLIGNDRMDSVSLDVKPLGKLLTICNCCQCCCIWRILPLIHDDVSSHILKMPGVAVSITDQCEGCGDCTEGICFVDGIRLVGDRAEINNECRGCGRCVIECPNEAIEIQFENPDFIEDSINQLSSLVDLS